MGKWGVSGMKGSSIAGQLEVLDHSVELGELAAAIGATAEMLEPIALVLVQTAIFQRTAIKHGPRGYRFALLEAGHAAENILLAAAAMGLGTLPWGGYLDDKLNALLGVDGVDETAVHCVLIGTPDG
jgi:SagB-type dehydrogenase family enzyme